MSDCITAQITANRITAIKAISIAGGYSFTPSVVEQPRLIRNVNGRYPFVEIIKGAIDPDFESLNAEQVPFYYTVTFEAQGNDDDPNSKPLVETYCNVVGDIIKAWMVDRTCGGLAEMTKTIKYDEGTVFEDGLNFYRAYVIFEVQALIDSSNPYLKG
jgi:hypothetical protein